MTTTIAAPITDEVGASLATRMSAMHRLFERATADLTREHVDHVERAGVLPIAFSLAHVVISEDRSVGRLLGGALLWDAHAERVRLEGGVPYRGTPMAEAERVRIGDLDAWRAYQREVFTRTDRLVLEAPLERLAEVVPVRPDALAFLSLLVGERDVRVIDALEAWVYQHGIRHVGEIEHARALVGLGGVS